MGPGEAFFQSRHMSPPAEPIFKSITTEGESAFFSDDTVLHASPPERKTALRRPPNAESAEPSETRKEINDLAPSYPEGRSQDQSIENTEVESSQDFNPAMYPNVSSVNEWATGSMSSS